jgi:hypothetical protein
MLPKRTQADANYIVGVTRSTSTFVLIFVSLLAVIPIWLSSYPPMCDLPQHAAQVALLRELQNPSFVYSRSFHVNWFTPYLLGYLLIYALTSVVGIVTACKIVVSILLMAMPLATGLLLREARVDVFWAVLSIPGLYGLAYQWGLLNFLIAAPLGLLFLSLFMHHEAKPTLTGALGIALGTCLLFFSHALVCAFFMMIAICYVIARARTIRVGCSCVAPLFFVVPMAVLWISLTKSQPVAREPMIIEGGLIRILGLFPRILGLRSILIATVVGVAVFALPFWAGASPKKSRAMWVPCCVCLATLLFVPEKVFGTNLVYERFTFFALPLFLVVLQEKKSINLKALIFRSVAILVVVGWIADVSYRAIVFDSRVKGFPDILAQMQPGQSALSMEFDRTDGVSLAPVFLHFPSWYAAQKNGIVDPSFAGFHPELVTYSIGFAPKVVVNNFEVHPEEFNWSEYHAEQYRYFVVRSQVDIGKALFSSATCHVALRYHSNEWWLYERDPVCPPNDVVH